MISHLPSLSFSLSLSLSLYLNHCLSLLLFIFSLYQSLSPSLYLSFSLVVHLCPPLSLSLSLCLSSHCTTCCCKVLQHAAMSANHSTESRGLTLRLLIALAYAFGPSLPTSRSYIFPEFSIISLAQKKNC